MKQNKTIFFIVLILISTIVLSGCGKKVIDCSTKNTSYIKYKYDEKSDQCVISSQITKNVCGNGIAEKGETFCNCPKDVLKTVSLEKGGCSGSKGDYLSYECNKNTKECELISTIDVKQESKLLSFNSGNYFALETEVYYNTPFIVDRDKIKFTIMLKSSLNTDFLKIRNITIEKIYIKTAQNVFLGEATVKQKLYKQFDEITVEVPIDKITFDQFDEHFKRVSLQALMSYTKDKYAKDKNEQYVLQDSSKQNVEFTQVFVDNFETINPESNNQEVGNKNQGSGWN